MRRWCQLSIGIDSNEKGGGGMNRLPVDAADVATTTHVLAYADTNTDNVTNRGNVGARGGTQSGVPACSAVGERVKTNCRVECSGSIVRQRSKTDAGLLSAVLESRSCRR
jgi:hypothetical protein